MNITERMKSAGKGSSTIEFDFPADSPEFKLKFERLAVGENKFFQEKAMMRAYAEGGGSSSALVLSFSLELARALENKLIGWEHKELEFNAENKKRFFDALGVVESQHLAISYQEAEARELERAEGNEPTSETDS